MKVTLAKSAGFCYGVRRAVELAEQVSGGENVVMLGPVIHNDQVIRRLAEQGVRCVERPEDVPEGATVILRSHGEPRSVYEALEKKHAVIADAACPNVTHIHKIVSEAEQRGRVPVIIGTPTHPEILAIAGWCGNPVVLPDADALEQWFESDEKRKNLPLTLVSQTTATREAWKKALKQQKNTVQILRYLIQYAVLLQNDSRRLRPSPHIRTS